MARRLFLIPLLLPAVVGCAGTWDRVSSRDFRENPMGTLFRTDDPMAVLRKESDGTARADAMQRLKEPAKNSRPAGEQQEALNYLFAAATTDHSPVVRVAAIDALGRFEDPEAVRLLVEAYRKADGIAASDATRTPDGKVIPAAAMDPIAMLAPTGFEPAFVSTLRTRTVEALATKRDPQAVAFLAKVATTPTPADANPSDRDVRAAAVRGLGKMRSKESVTALTEVLKQESGRDVVLTQTAHEGLKELTGKELPDAGQGGKVVPAGGPDAKPTSLVERMGWAGK